MEPRDLPSIDALASRLAPRFDLPRPVVVHVCREAIDRARSDLLAGGTAEPDALADQRLADIAAARPRTVINATGVLLHTNLGRASLAADTAAELADASASTANIEIDLRTGRRASRHTYLGEVLAAATGAEAGFAVNNNAGALLVALASVAGRGGRVAVSRGELIEIGGSFRLPELMASSGARLVEVGTTNRTRLADYAAVAGTVDAILKVHPSNYRVEGFHEDVAHGELASLAAQAGIPFLHDVGSGLLDERAPWLGTADRGWLAGEPGVIQAVAAGADLTMFSGDKLLGGPQAGILVGTAPAVGAAQRHPIARAVRLDGGTIAALAATIERYLDQRVTDIPFWAMAAATIDQIDTRARTVAEGLDGVDVVDGASIPGAGSVPGATIPTRVLRIAGNADDVWARLAGDAASPVVATRRDGAVFIDLRSVQPRQDATVRATLERAIG